MKFKKIVLLIIVCIIGIILGYLWYGFLFPDPFWLSRASFSGKIIYLWMPRILIPLLYFVILILILMKNRKTAQNIAVMLAAILIIGIILYPAGDIIFSLKSISENKADSQRYHPYLQLNPPSSQRLDSIPEKGTYRIFCLGGSTTEFTDSNGSGWPDRLEKELRSICKSDLIYVFNFGRQWYTTLHSLINYETNLRHYKPDAIILMHNFNDLVHNADFNYFSKGSFRTDYGHYLGPTTYIFEKNGFFGHYLNNIKHTWYFKQRITVEQDSFPGIESYARNINTLIDLALLDKTKVILLSQPNIYYENMDDEIKKVCGMVNIEAVGKDKKWGYITAFIGMKEYNERIKEVAEDRDVYFIDLEKHIPKSLAYFTDEVHYADTTFNIISNFLAGEIVKYNILTNKK